MQTRAIIVAALAQDHLVNVELIPLINDQQELLYLKAIIEEEIKKLSPNFKYKLGTMIESQGLLFSSSNCSSCILLSFGTNDLTQMTYGFVVMMLAVSYISIMNKDLSV